MNKIGKRLRSLQEGVRITQIKLAVVPGIQQSGINRHEMGAGLSGPEMFVKYADFFDASMDCPYFNISFTMLSGITNSGLPCAPAATSYLSKHITMLPPSFI